MTATLKIQGTQADVARMVQQIALALAGKGADPTGGMVRGLQLRLGCVLLGLIQKDFLTKSRGGTGVDGIKWKPLAPSTIAKRRQGPGTKKLVTLKARAPGLSNSDKARIAKEVKAQTASLMVKFGLGHNEAAGLARAQVEGRWRRKGAAIATKFAILAGRDVPILIDTQELFNTFSPGVDSVGPGGILRISPGYITVGTNRKPWHHRGNKNLPQRAYWPPNGQLPAAWWVILIGEARKGIAEIVVYMMSKRKVA